MQFVPRMPAKTEVQPLALLLLALSFSFFYAHVSVCLPRSTKRSARAAGPPPMNSIARAPDPKVYPIFRDLMDEALYERFD